jgi:S-adenosylmethionine hydrolase
VAVVDPGVGGERRPVMLRVDDRWYVGPDNGLFTLVERRARQAECRVIEWRPDRLSASFHGRDLFAPVAARLARGEMPKSRLETLTPPPGPSWPDDWARILYIDRFGNAVTGLRASGLARTASLRAGKRVLKHARVFADVAEGEGFWYENANGLVEIAVNHGSAARRYGLRPGSTVHVGD